MKISNPFKRMDKDKAEAEAMTKDEVFLAALDDDVREAILRLIASEQGMSAFAILLAMTEIGEISITGHDMVDCIGAEGLTEQFGVALDDLKGWQHVSVTIDGSYDGNADEFADLVGTNDPGWEYSAK